MKITGAGDMTYINGPDLEGAIEEGGKSIARDDPKLGNVVVVTGAAQGFGPAIALRLAGEGADGTSAVFPGTNIAERFGLRRKGPRSPGQARR